MKRLSKREMVLEIYDREAMGEVTAREIAIINDALVAEFGEGGAMTPAEIARVLVDEDLPVRFDQIFRMATPAEKYENLLSGLISPGSLEEAEESIRRIDELHRQFVRHNDRTGIRFARQTAMRAKENALIRSESPNLPSEVRALQAEIAQWFTIWLQTPDLFESWLDLRRASRDFKALFPAPADKSNEESEN